MESTQHDPLVGTWVLTPSRSQFDANHRPQAATLVIERDDQGRYLITAEGIGENGQKVTEKPQTLVPDGQARPLPDFPGLAVTSTRPDERTLHTDCRREDGRSPDRGTVRGVRGWSVAQRDYRRFDSQLRRFEQRTQLGQAAGRRIGAVQRHSCGLNVHDAAVRMTAATFPRRRANAPSGLACESSLLATPIRHSAARWTAGPG